MNVTTEDRLFEMTLPATGETAKPPARGRRVLRTLLWATVGAVGAITAVAAIGARYEMVSGSQDLSAYPPAGRLVDVGGYRMHLDCRGEGAPTVVMDAGLGGSSLENVAAPGRYLAHFNYLGVATTVSSNSSAQTKLDATFTVTPALAGGTNCVSFQSANGYWLRHTDYRVRLEKNTGTATFLDFRCHRA